MKTIIVYFSWSNNTKNLVNDINKTFNFDILRIERKVPYSTDYNICAYKEAKEEWENGIYPEIKEINIDLNQYDKILLFFPIWWYTFPHAIGTFITNNLKDYKGKVILFENSYTNDRQYVFNSLKDFKALNSSINVRDGLFNKSVSDHIKYIKENN